MIKDTTVCSIVQAGSPCNDMMQRDTMTNSLFVFSPFFSLHDLLQCQRYQLSSDSSSCDTDWYTLIQVVVQWVK